MPERIAFGLVRRHLVWFIFAVAGCLSLSVSSVTRGQEPACESHQLDPDRLKQRLRRWNGMSSFSHWRLTRVRPERCANEGKVAASLLLVPPACWSHNRVPYRVEATIILDAETGNPIQAPPNGQRLASGVRRLILRAEAHEDVGRFIERFAPIEAEITGAEDGGGLRVEFSSGSGEGSAVRRAALVFSEVARNGVTAYRLPRMDSLPVRRELLRFVESFSRFHPRCRLGWIEARWIDRQPPTETQTGRWEILARVSGERCPETFSKAVTGDLTIVDWVPSGAGRAQPE